MIRAVLVGILFFGSVVHAGTLPEPKIGNMTSVQLKSGGDATIRGLDLVGEAGFQMVRHGIRWGRVEQTKGTYDFASIDRLVSDAEKRGLTISFTLFGNNELYESGPRGGSNRRPGPAITTAAGRAGFAAFAKATAAHLKGRKVIYEIWNEPNIKSFWREPHNSDEIADEYTALVKTVAPAIRAADPSAYIVAGSISALWEKSFFWFDRCVAQGILKSGINGISVHPYGFNQPEQAANGYAVIRAKMNAAGGQALSIVNTEVGYSEPWIQKRQGYTQAQAQDVQGWMMVRQQLMDLMSGLGYSVWYEFRDSEKWGVVNSDFTPRPTYYISRTFTEQLTGYAFVRQIATASPLDYVVLLQNAAGRQKLVVWTTSDMSKPLIDRPAKPHNIAIAITGTGAVEYVDINGMPGSYKITDGKISALLEGGPKYIDLSTATAPK